MQLESCFIDIGLVVINHAIVIRIFKHVEAKNVRLLVPCYLALPLQIFEQFFSLARPNLYLYEFCDQFEYDSDLFRSTILSLSKGQVTVCITPLSCKSLSTYLPLPVRLTRCTRPRVRHHTRHLISRIIAHKITARYLRRVFFRFRLPYWEQ